MKRCASAASWPSSRRRSPRSTAWSRCSRSRRRARRRAVGPSGEPILLLDQNRGAVGSAADPARPGGARARGSARRGARPLRAPGGDRRVPRAGADAGGHRLDAHRGALRAARHARALAGRRAEPRRRGRDGVRTRRRASISSRRWPANRRCAAITCCRACAAISSSNSAALEEAGPEFQRAAALHAQRPRRELLRRTAACAPRA